MRDNSVMNSCDILPLELRQNPTFSTFLSKLLLLFQINPMILNLNNYDIFPHYDHDFYIILNYLFGYAHDLSPSCKISGYIIYGSVFGCILGDALGRVWALELLGLDYWTVEP